MYKVVRFPWNLSSTIKVCLIVSQISFNNKSASGLIGPFLKQKQHRHQYLYQ